MKTVLVSVMCIFLFSSSLINVAEGHRRFQKGLMLGYILGSQRRGHPAPPHVVPVPVPVHHHHPHHGHGHEHGHGHGHEGGHGYGHGGQ